MQDIVLCGVPLLTDVRAQAGHILSKRGTVGKLEQNAIIGLHALNAYSSPELSRSFSVVEFSWVYTQPVGIVRAAAAKAGRRLRLLSPYRELMAQRFGFVFSRIALIENLKLPPD